MDIGSFIDTWLGPLGLLLTCVCLVYLWIWADEPRGSQYAWTAMALSFAFLYIGDTIDATGWVETALLIGQIAFLVLFFLLVRWSEQMEWKV
jgi:hypothetical protein